MDHQDVARCFTQSDGSYLFARWGRPIVPIVFGVDDATLSVVKGAIEAVVALAGHRMAETDADLGANLMVFFFRDWDELLLVPDLDRLVPELASLVERLKAEGANRYRLFRFDDAGAIRAAFVFIRMDDALARLPAEDLALAEATQSILLWSESAFRDVGPLGLVGSRVMLRPEIADIVRAAYDPVMPDVATDPSHALRLAARITVQRSGDG